VLVNPRQGVVKIADFGLARMHNEQGERFTQQVREGRLVGDGGGCLYR